MNEFIINKPGMNVKVTDTEVFVNDVIVFSKDETNEPKTIPSDCCNAVNSGGDTTVVYVDGHLFDSKKYDIQIVLNKK